ATVSNDPVRSANAEPRGVHAGHGGGGDRSSDDTGKTTAGKTGSTGYTFRFTAKIPGYREEPANRRMATGLTALTPRPACPRRRTENASGICFLAIVSRLERVNRVAGYHRPSRRAKGAVGGRSSHADPGR